MNNERIITEMLEVSHGRASGEGTLLVERLHSRRWRRRANRVANSLAVAFVCVTAVLTLFLTSAPDYSSYQTSQAGAFAESDCLFIHQLLES
jgi:hypothetical protein